MGNDNAQSLTRLQEETQMGKYDLFIHNGDFAYDMEDVRKGDNTIKETWGRFHQHVYEQLLCP